MLTLTIVIALLFAATARAGGPSKGSAVAEAIVATWTCEDKLPRPRTKARSPWKHHSKAYWAAELNLWQGRHRQCRAILAERARQWNWQAWLPPKWQRIAQCETGLDFHFTNSQYVSAFGIARSSWAAFRPADVPAVPEQASPWQQWQVALAIYNRYGFSGWGCRNA